MGGKVRRGKDGALLRWHPGDDMQSKHPSNTRQWRFAPTGGGILHGYHNAGAEHFMPDPIGKLVRETIQNSLDAHEDGLPPVIVDIRECDIAADHIGAASLEGHLNQARLQTRTKGQQEGEQDYRRALRLIRKPTIPCLAVIDRNTTGLQGRKWDSLIYEEGTPEKDGPGAPGGSFGIGKNAPYNVSGLHTVIYSTRYANGRQGRVEKMTGRAQLVSHPDPDDGQTMLQHIGFYADDADQPIYGPDIPAPFRLDEPGTGLWVAGFIPDDGEWQQLAVRAAVDSFFYAIHNDRLVVNIQTRSAAEPLVICRDTLDGILEAGRGSPRTGHYYRAVRSSPKDDATDRLMRRMENPVHIVPESWRQLILDEIPDDMPAMEPAAGHSVRIDHAFPEQFVDGLSRQEVFNKHLFRPNTYLHKWWARRCGSTFRAILKQFAPDADRRDYYAAGGLAGKVVLDPMLGGGTTLHEAIRMGANVIGADIDPIPIVQARASLSRASLADLRVAFNRFYDALYGRLGHYFETECPICAATTDIQYTLYGVCKRCACRNVVQVEQYVLRQDDATTVCINPYTGDIATNPNGADFDGTGRNGVGTNGAAAALIAKPDKECPACGQQYEGRFDLPLYARYAPVAIAGVCAQHGSFYRTPGEWDLARIKQADAQRSALDFGPAEDFAVSDGPKSGDLLRHKIASYLDVFSSRQLLYLHHAIDLLREYDGVARLNLGALVSTSLEFNSMLCGYKGWYRRRPGAIRHTFALHAYSFQYTALENNPVNPHKSSGNLKQLFHDRIERGRKWAARPVERQVDAAGKKTLVKIYGETDDGVEVFDANQMAGGRSNFHLIQGDSQNLPVADNSVDIVVTDPPYYDSVQYGNLAEFFRVWLARLLPEAAEWNYDASGAAVVAKAGNINDSNISDSDNYMTALAGIFAECRRVLKPTHGRMVFTFHHWDPDAWAELTIALKNAGFRLVNSYVVYSEHPISVHIRNLNSIRHDCILVLAPDTTGDAAESWQPMAEIDTSDSERFCRQCGAALGWLLGSEITPPAVRDAWRKLLGK